MIALFKNIALILSLVVVAALIGNDRATKIKKTNDIARPIKVRHIKGQYNELEYE
jgi:hypothetical protein